MVQIPEILTLNGWKFYEKCRCQNILKYKFRNANKPGLEIEWWISYYQFKVTEKNKTKIPPTKMGELDNILKTL